MTRARFLMLVALSCVLVTANAGAQSTGSLKGAWKVVAVTAADGKVDTAPQPGLYVFSDKHYSTQRVNSARPATAGVSSPDKDRLAAYDAFTANTGTYEVKGNTLTTKPLVAKNPSVMGTTAPSELRFEGTSVVHVTSANPGGTGKTSVKLQRVE